MDDTVVDAVLTLPENWTGGRKTTHYRGGTNVTEFVSSVSIAHYEDVDGVYLFYRDASGNDLNDLFFDTLTEAISHLRFEFGDEALQFLSPQPHL